MPRRDAGHERELVLLGGEVARRRALLGLTQPELAARAEMSLDGVLRIEKGKSAPTVVTLLKLAAALGCELTDVVGVLDSRPRSGNGARSRRDAGTARVSALLEGQPPEVVAAAETCVRALVNLAAGSRA